MDEQREPDARTHWEDVYRSKDADDVSWFQRDPEVSLRLIGRVPGSVVDVGAGASLLVDRLLESGRDDVTLLDVSAEALAVTRRRLDEDAPVRYVVDNVLDWQPGRTFDVWHDRAVFHFLTRDDERERYVRTANAAVAPGGAIVMGAFAIDGPTQCSGLPTARYAASGLAEIFAEQFALEQSQDETHVTPWGTEQHFTWVLLRRLGAQPRTGSVPAAP